MKRPLLLFCALCLLLVVNAAQGQIGVFSKGATNRKVEKSGGGPGSTYNKAISIHAADWKSGVATEYSYIQTHFPGSKALNHAREYYTDKTFDVITFTTADGVKRAVYFRYWKHS